MENSEIPPSPPILLKLKSYEYPNLNPYHAIPIIGFIEVIN